MPAFAFIGAFIPFLAMLPPSIAAVWIAHRWLKTRGAGSELHAEVAALKDEMAALRQTQAELQERVDFAERMLAQVREGPRLPNASS
jgi:hypothetical protein